MGQGLGYRQDVADLIRDWYLAHERDDIHRLLERRFVAAW